MKFSFELKTDATLEQVWGLYEDVNKWFSWESDLEDISLESEFKTGTHGTMKLVGRPQVTFVLESVTTNKEFTNKTIIPSIGEIYFSHEISKIDDKTLVKHSVEFVPLNRKAISEDLGLVSQVFSSVPKSVFSLLEVANG
ncbi:SRPBCC family protein [Brochothrix campestris]|uniref:Polyketide cyclase/dehydrase and lipid transport n=1 Tax=Brochothrix campestris FSL F6-1037 TaxID=1265861 RepID=W7CJS1_9LIST|nr:hypothetical protein [Brochothrix campestris]EUJ39639.1 hypothetical protein BCAMP_06882 [Brochothrix campestris FSL F6-1037]